MLSFQRGNSADQSGVWSLIRALMLDYAVIIPVSLLLFSFIPRYPGAPSPLALTISLVVVWGVMNLVRSVVMSANAQRLTLLSEHLTALRMCGACGGDLRSAEVHPDGCVVCPECSAAWNRDRFVLVEKAALDPAALRALIKKGYLAKHSDLTSDRRGVLLEVPLRCPPRWFGSGKAPAEVEERFIVVVPGKCRRFMLATASAAIVLLAVSMVAQVITPPRDFDRGVFLMITTGLSIAFAFIVMWRVYRGGLILRMPVVEFGLSAPVADDGHRKTP